VVNDANRHGIIGGIFVKAFFSGIFQQIASSVIDEPYSGFLVNQNINESFDVLEYEMERTSISAGTYSISMPSGLASNKQSLLFVSSDTDVTIEVTTRDFGNTTDETFTAEVRPNEPLYIVVHNIKGATVTATGSANIQCFVAKIRIISNSSFSSPNQGLDPGSLPVGGIIALSGAFATTAPPGGYSEAPILPLPSYLQQCDGSIVSDSESVFFGRYLPDLTGDKTLFGATTAGVYTSFSTSPTVLTGFGSDWNIYQSVDVAAAYRVRFYMRIK
jgi:hypothetical protein